MTEHEPNAAAAVVICDTGEILLIQRGREPSRGLWTLPGGRIEPGETPAMAAAREVLEETGLHVRVLEFLVTVELGPPSRFVIDEFLAEPERGTDADALSLVAGDDAAAARWVRRDEMDALGVNVEALAVIDRAIATRRARDRS